MPETKDQGSNLDAVRTAFFNVYRPSQSASDQPNGYVSDPPNQPDQETLSQRVLRKIRRWTRRNLLGRKRGHESIVMGFVVMERLVSRPIVVARGC